ncbi:hypothetical protein B0H13DRAFT_2036978 [Mycena leptocephala]|nr:hypothetical protein B0H13DRAFT_2036978 [Mycena leptocephala]
MVRPIWFHDRAARAPPVRRQQRCRRGETTTGDTPVPVPPSLPVPVVSPPPATPARGLPAKRRWGYVPVPIRHGRLVNGPERRTRDVRRRRRRDRELFVRRPADAPRLDVCERSRTAVVRFCTVVSVWVLRGVPLRAREQRLGCFWYVLGVLGEVK